MKIVMSLIVALASLTAVAEPITRVGLDAARQAERDARDARERGYDDGYGRGDRGYDDGYGRGDRDYDNGYGRPGRRPGRPLPPPPPYRPDRPGRDEGDGYTARWRDAGTVKVGKLVEENITINVRGEYVNEILLRAVGSAVEIQRVTVELSSGRMIDLYNATGTVREGREIRARLDRRNSLRVDRIIIQAMSPSIIGSRGQLNTVLGLAY